MRDMSKLEEEGLVVKLKVDKEKFAKLKKNKNLKEEEGKKIEKVTKTKSN